VLILHTHGTESYRNTEGYTASSAYRTEDADYNMISVGAHLTRCLEAGGIRVIHDRTPYDQPSYSGSYSLAREAVITALADNPSLCLVLDLHRDAMTGSDGEQLAYTCTLPEGTAAKLMLVAGSDAGGLSYPNWQDNLTLAVQLQAVLERQNPGLCRSLSFRTGRYNQDLFPNMLLVEVGAAGNTRGEALLAVEKLAEAILEMASGTEYAQ
jgi:stage II sporulation protein P